MRNLTFKVEYFGEMINIDTGNNQSTTDFTYGNILNMYKTKSSQGHGIQVNDPKLEKPLLEMCDKISNAVYDFIKETQ